MNRYNAPDYRGAFVHEPDWLIRQRELMDKCAPFARYRELRRKWESPAPPSPVPPKPIGLENAERMREMLRPIHKR